MNRGFTISWSVSDRMMDGSLERDIHQKKAASQNLHGITTLIESPKAFGVGVKAFELV